MRRIVQLLVFLAAVYPVAASAQATKAKFKPFLGTWVLNVAGSESAQSDGRPASPATIVISRDQKALRIETVREGKTLVATYPFEQDARLVAKSGGNPVGTIEWEDGTLMTVTPYEVNEMAVTTIERRSLSSNGKEMTIVRTVAVQHGYESGPNASAPLTQVFQRAR
jgi:hypothetical protein